MRRTKTGLQWLEDKGRIGPGERMVGQRVEAVLGKATAGYAVSGLELSNSILKAVPGPQGKAILDVVLAICGRGQTPRQLAGDSSLEAARVEERLLTGLALARAHFEREAALCA